VVGDVLRTGDECEYVVRDVLRTGNDCEYVVRNLLIEDVLRTEGNCEYVENLPIEEEYLKYSFMLAVIITMRPIIKPTNNKTFTANFINICKFYLFLIYCTLHD